ncbi:hypothetical protein Patl_2401 [Paraglaciecola sp. T6c]|uniref:DUF2608 domain-containing protein n=1 Tax=Pseudoalteromonas atlantica (strain T6c / ATCC BAA-1087) TaxID=3042615 RepID=UPI00005C731D|nr:DUF2608 domain-containing protein [Paraglaciecola sp. T6c]ABG40917.1 hypothetical protein Patl_2401 [Paraglaciecola sp. T6c]
MLKNLSVNQANVTRLQRKSLMYAGMFGLSVSLLLGGCASGLSSNGNTQASTVQSATATSIEHGQIINVVYSSNDLQDAVNKANALDAQSTLLVFDIDDTLLTATEFFGSDKWYDWQRGRAISPSGKVIATQDSEKVNCLFDTLGMVFEIAVNKPTQADMATLVNGVSNDVVILTARSGAYRAGTMRELARNQLDFSDKSLTSPDVGLHYDYTLGGRTANVSYVDGVFMVQGMNKGVMLLDLLARTGHEYSSVVFVDDKQHNIDNMANALKSAGVNFYGYHYTRIAKTVTDEEVAQANAAREALSDLLSAHFADRAKHINQRQCDY